MLKSIAFPVSPSPIDSYSPTGSIPQLHSRETEFKGIFCRNLSHVSSVNNPRIKICDLLGFYAASIGSFSPKF